MNLEELIYQGLREQHEATPEVFLEDLLRQGCGYRHYLSLKGTEGKPERGNDVLMQEVTLRIRRMVGGYLKGTFGDDFTPGGIQLQGGVTLVVDGYLQGQLVEVSVVSTSEYNQSRPPRRSVLSAAVKAHLLGAESALLIQFDRNSQEWSFWNVTGELEQAAEQVVQDIGYVNRLVAGDAIAIGLASESTCRRCPFVDVCDVEKQGDPPSYLLRGVKARPEPKLQGKVDDHLWSKNAEDNGRRTKVLHPSSFSRETCDREQAYDLLGEEELEKVDPKLRRIFDVGHCFHDLIQEVLEVVVPGFVPETEVWHPELLIYGHCDGEFGEDGIEIKSINDAGFRKLVNPKSEHKRQATIYGAIRKLKQIHYIYVNKETGELKVLPTKLNRSSWHKQAARAANIIKTVGAGELPPQIDSDYTCRKCKYAWTCKPKGRSKPKRTFA